MKINKHLIICDPLWGDSGKARVADYFAAEYDFCVRFQGSNNAGHTVVIGNKKVVLHAIPCGILTPGVKCIIGQGCVIDPNVLQDELYYLKNNGINDILERLYVSDKCHLITKDNILKDIVRECGPNKIGTTKRGVGPAYANKAARIGFKAASLNIPGLQVVNVSELLKQAFKDNKKVLYEGAQGIMLDVDFGVYPYTTSSHTVPAYAGIGSGYPIQENTEIYGVVKAYTTYVGEGPFLSDLQTNGFKVEDELIRSIGNEYGSTTGRPRRIGWLDLPALRYACEIGGITKLILTKLDVLTNIQPYVCYNYRSPLREQNVNWTEQNLSLCTPEFLEVPGWTQDLSVVKSYEELEQSIKEFINLVEASTGTKVIYLSTGPERSQMIKVE